MQNPLVQNSLSFYCDFLKWTVKPLTASSGGLKRSSTQYDEEQERLPCFCQDWTQNVQPATRLLASSHQSNFFCFLSHEFRVYGLLGQPLLDINSSPELSSPGLPLTPATPAPLREVPLSSLLWHRLWKNMRGLLVTADVWAQGSQWVLLNSTF